MLAINRELLANICLASIVAGALSSLRPAEVTVELKDEEIDVLIDSGVSNNVIDQKLATALNLSMRGTPKQISAVSLTALLLRKDL